MSRENMENLPVSTSLTVPLADEAASSTHQSPDSHPIAPLDSFHYFTDLPPELRFMIWEMALRRDLPSAHFFSFFDNTMDYSHSSLPVDAIARFNAYHLLFPPVLASPACIPRLAEDSDDEISTLSANLSAVSLNWAAPSTTPAPATGAEVVAHEANPWKMGGNASMYLHDHGMWRACSESRHFITRELGATVNHIRPDWLGTISAPELQAFWWPRAERMVPWTLVMRPSADIVVLDMVLPQGGYCTYKVFIEYLEVLSTVWRGHVAIRFSEEWLKETSSARRSLLTYFRGALAYFSLLRFFKRIWLLDDSLHLNPGLGEAKRVADNRVIKRPAFHTMSGRLVGVFDGNEVSEHDDDLVFSVKWSIDFVLAVQEPNLRSKSSIGILAWQR